MGPIAYDPGACTRERVAALHEEILNEHTYLAELDAPSRRLALREVLAKRVTETELAGAVAELADVIDGFGPLTRVMDDPTVTDVLVNGPSQVWIDRQGTLERCSIEFDPDELSRLIDRLLSQGGRSVDLATPIADARLTDGSRVHVVLPPIARDGPYLSIRRMPRRRPMLEDLDAWGMFDDGHLERLETLIDSRASLAISGATGTGKTTLMNALLQRVPATQRVVTIEETPELTLGSGQVSLVARAANPRGAGEITLDELVRTALRMRPDRIVVGEVRGAEVLAALSAMSTGHQGSMLTVHARSALDALDRLVDLALGAGSGSSEQGLYRRVTRAIDAVVHLVRSPQGRRVDEIRATSDL